LESGFNFGPDSDSNRNVGDLVSLVLDHWPGEWIDASEGNAPHEARFLHLSTDKAASLLRWRPVWAFERTIAETVGWYRDTASASHSVIAEYTRRQIACYSADAAAAGLPWAAR
jgi:CDP-glucose 4,6-dehydratase